MRPLVYLLVTLFVLILLSCDNKTDTITGETLKVEDLKLYLENDSIRARYNNDAFDNHALVTLSGDMPDVEGEILNPGRASIDNLLLRSVVVKEYCPQEDSEDPVFEGAFQYYGYSLADLLKHFVINKHNSQEYGLTTDMYVLVEGKGGDFAVFSWGELFFTGKHNDIILATAVQAVFPTHDSTIWPVPEKIKLVAANDYLTVRNIDEPVRIEILSSNVSFPGEKGFRPLFSKDITIYSDAGEVVKIDKQQVIDKKHASQNTFFFGMHKGARGERQFSGTPLSDVLREEYNFSITELQRAVIIFGALDGYRALFSLSEIVNRTDMKEIMLVDIGNDENGRFIIRPGADFFADRHLKAPASGYLEIFGNN